MKGTYYNENDPYVCQWLRNLMAAGLISQGDVDERDIRRVGPDDVRGYKRCHFFAGIAGWDLALRLAGWPEDREVWTGSCPCQPFSVAGKRQGSADERHLWPEWLRFVRARRPAVVFGEQVASADGKVWLAGVRSDLERMSYAFAAGDIPAAGVSAPHCRQRLYWVADSSGERRQQIPRGASGHEAADGRARRDGSQAHVDYVSDGTGQGTGVGLGDTNGYHEHWWSGSLQVGWNAIQAKVERSGRRIDAQWRVKPGVPLVANGIPQRVAKLCAIGNAIVPQVAAEVIRAFLDVRP